MRLKNFDSVFVPSESPDPRPSDADVDLATETVRETVETTACPDPSKMTEAEFKENFSNVDATITLTFGVALTVTCYVVGTQAFVSSPTKAILPGVLSGASAKPIFMYAGGSWISESAKVTRF